MLKRGRNSRPLLAYAGIRVGNHLMIELGQCARAGPRSVLVSQEPGGGGGITGFARFLSHFMASAHIFMSRD